MVATLPFGGVSQAQPPSTPLLSDRNFYELMDVEQDASVDQIKAQFTILEATFDSLGEDVVKSLKRARDILTVPSSRERYDKELKEVRTPALLTDYYKRLRVSKVANR